MTTNCNKCDVMLKNNKARETHVCDPSLVENKAKRVAAQNARWAEEKAKRDEREKQRQEDIDTYRIVTKYRGDDRSEMMTFTAVGKSGREIFGHELYASRDKGWADEGAWKSWEINWSSIGAVPVKEAKIHANLIAQAVQFVELRNAEAGKQ